MTIKEAFVWQKDPAWQWKMQCPACGYDYVHHGNVKVFTRPDGEDGVTVVLTPGDPREHVSAYNPSDRRDAIRMYMWGECGHDWTLDLIQHKGQTFLALTINPESVGFLQQMPYAEYLQSKHWKHTRTAAIERAGGACQLCNRTAQLHVHHRTYERLGEELPEDLTVLCKSCHERFHGISNGKVTRAVKAG